MSAAPERRYDLLTLGETLLRLSPPGRSAARPGTALRNRRRRQRVECRLPLGQARAAGRLGVAPSRGAARPDRRRRGAPARRRYRLGPLDPERAARAGLLRPGQDRRGRAASSTTESTRRPPNSASRMRPGRHSCRRAPGCSLSGITPSLGPRCRALTLHIAALAASAGKPVSYDLNYRATLTNPTEARAVFRSGRALSASPGAGRARCAAGAGLRRGGHAACRSDRPALPPQMRCPDPAARRRAGQHAVGSGCFALCAPL